MKIVSQKLALDAGIFKVFEVKLLNNKKELTHSVLRFTGTICVLPVTEKGTIILERQYRTALDRYILEIPAGKIDAGELPEICLHRELEEETGLRAIKFKKCFEGFVTCGYSDEYMHYFVALTEKIPDDERKHFPDTDEEIELVEITVEKALEMIKEKEIIDSKTITLIYLYASGAVHWE
ncbi:MAG TPA: NUDIX hydrolase [bacterium]|nr:NUDIX hydrolase [bacterium]